MMYLSPASMSTLRVRCSGMISAILPESRSTTMVAGLKEPSRNTFCAVKTRRDDMGAVAALEAVPISGPL